MRASTIIMFGLALLFGGIAVFMSQSWLDRQAERKLRDVEVAEPAPVSTATLVVAATPVKFGAEVTPANLKEIPWPTTAVPAGAFAKIGDVFAPGGKRVALGSMEANEPILVTKLSGPGQRATLSAVIGAGMMAVTVRVDEVNGVAGFVLPGDRVDALLTRRQDEGQAITEVLAERARVLAVDQSFDQRAEKPSVPKAVTLEVESAVAQKVAFASSVGTISLVLRRSGEAEVASDPASRARQSTVSVSRGGRRQDYAVRSETVE